MMFVYALIGPFASDLLVSALFVLLVRVQARRDWLVQ